jgi:hypothetical protein
MAYENTATLYKVVSENPKSPVMRCLIDINGEKFVASLWKRTNRETGEPLKDKNGNMFYGGNVEPESQVRQGQPPAEPEENPEEIPF